MPTRGLSGCRIYYLLSTSGFCSVFSLMCHTHARVPSPKVTSHTFDMAECWMPEKRRKHWALNARRKELSLGPPTLPGVKYLSNAEVTARSSAAWAMTLAAYLCVRARLIRVTEHTCTPDALPLIETRALLTRLTRSDMQYTCKVDTAFAKRHWVSTEDLKK